MNFFLESRLNITAVIECNTSTCSAMNWTDAFFPGKLSKYSKTPLLAVIESNTSTCSAMNRTDGFFLESRLNMTAVIAIQYFHV